MKKIIFAAALLLACSALMAGNLKFSSMIGDNMVLQQNTKVRREPPGPMPKGIGR